MVLIITFQSYLIYSNFFIRTKHFINPIDQLTKFDDRIPKHGKLKLDLTDPRIRKNQKVYSHQCCGIVLITQGLALTLIEDSKNYQLEQSNVINQKHLGALSRLHYLKLNASSLPLKITLSILH
jgi:hypothetical protein